MAATDPTDDRASDRPDDLASRAHRLRRQTRRSVLRHRRKILALSLGLAVLAGLRTVSPPEPETVPLLVASRDLPAGQHLTADDLQVVRAPPALAPAGSQSLEEAIGRTTTGPVRRGESLTDARLVTESLLDGYPGRVALPVRLPDPGAVELLQVGDLIDLVATDPTDGLADQIASAVPVISIPIESETSAMAGGPQLSGRLVVLAVTPPSAKMIAAAAATRYLAAVISR